MDPTLRKLPLINFWLIQFSAIPGMKRLSCPSQFVLYGQRAINNNFQEKELSSTLAFVRLHVAAAATVHQEPHF